MFKRPAVCPLHQGGCSLCGTCSSNGNRLSTGLELTITCTVAPDMDPLALGGTLLDNLHTSKGHRNFMAYIRDETLRRDVKVRVNWKCNLSSCKISFSEHIAAFSEDDVG